MLHGRSTLAHRTSAHHFFGTSAHQYPDISSSKSGHLLIKFWTSAHQSPLSGREGRAGRLVPPSLPAPDTPFPHKEHKIGFPVITCSPSQHGRSQDVDILSPELPREVPRFFRRGGFKGRFSKLPALPYISSRQLKCVATPRTRGGRASIKERAVLRKILHFVCAVRMEEQLA